jgi:hypothetical protein
MSKRTDNLKKNLMEDSYFDFTKNSENKSNININDMHYVQSNKNEYNTLNEGVWTSLVRNFNFISLFF